MGSRWEGVRDRREWEASLRTSFNMLGIVLLGPFQWTQPGSIFQNGVLIWVPLIEIEHYPHSPIPCLLLPSPHWETIPQNIAAFIHLLCTIKNFRITISISPLTSLWNKGFNIFCIFKKVLEYMPQCVSIRNAVFKNHFKQLSFIWSVFITTQYLWWEDVLYPIFYFVRLIYTYLHSPLWFAFFHLSWYDFTFEYANGLPGSIVKTIFYLNQSYI